MHKAYLDNLRFATVLLVCAYHVCYLYNGVGVPGAIPGAASLPAMDMAAAIVYPWFMVLLFVIAGMSARYSLQKRTVRQFLRERRDRLLVPSTLGLFIIHWVTGYLNIRMGGGLAFIPAALLYPISAISGIGPLWFIQMLFLFSLLLALLRRLDRADRLWQAGGQLGLSGILALCLPLWGASQLFNLPVLTMYRFGIYLAAFLIGYLVLSHERAQQALGRACLPLLAAAAVAGSCFALRWQGQDYTAPACLQRLGTNLYAWLATLALIGCAQRFWNAASACTRYLARSSFGIYLLHYPVLLALCLFFQERCTLPPLANYLLAFSFGPAITLGLYELLRRVPAVRYLVLGQNQAGRASDGARLPKG